MGQIIVSKCFLFLCLVIFSSFSFSGSDSFKAQMLKAINDFNRSELSSIFNEAKRRQSKEDVELMESLFIKSDYLLNEDRSAFVRVNAANVILQSHRNGEYDNDEVVASIRLELIGWVDSKDMDVKREAIGLLRYYDDQESFMLLLTLISKQDRHYFSYALYSIYFLCDAFNEVDFRKAYNGFSKSNKALSDKFERGHRQALINAGWCNQ